MFSNYKSNLLVIKLKKKNEFRKTNKQALTDCDCSDLAEHLKGGNAAYGDVHGSKLNCTVTPQFVFCNTTETNTSAVNLCGSLCNKTASCHKSSESDR